MTKKFVKVARNKDDNKIEFIKKLRDVYIIGKEIYYEPEYLAYKMPQFLKDIEDVLTRASCIDFRDCGEFNDIFKEK